MKKIVNQSWYNTNVDIKIVSNGKEQLWKSLDGKYYIYDGNDMIRPIEEYEVRDWVLENGIGFLPDDLKRIKKYVELNFEEFQ